MVRATRAEHPMCQSRACCKDIIVGKQQFIPSRAQRGEATLVCRAECSESEIVRENDPHFR